MERKSAARNFWKKYRRWILVALVAYVAIMLVLILITGGPQSEPFIYQVF